MTWLPMWALYRVSDLLAPILYHIVRYRRRVVRTNLERSFPEKSPAEIRKISREFYRRFADNFVESIKLLSISDKEMKRRVIYENVELVDEYLRQGKTLIAYFAHTGNWEWAPSITLWSHAENSPVFAQVYRPLRNARADHFFLKLRSRFGSLSFKKNNVIRDLLRLRATGRPSMTGFMSDQKPSHSDPGHLTTFLHRPTLMISGTEHLARKLKAPVVYMRMLRERRGHYRVSIVPMADDASTLAPGELTEKYVRLLEENIVADPAGWLWSHNRWKHPVTLPQTTDVQP
ncbi:MAG: lysophospholipid acyltransferase family protein [Candidatus Amulumruptor caecigallinarius]|nr:lysophospholipid acyltransferase family protein [Candidatus Amulumruptor caecigallinarius]MCM1396730.1 lysophospholipid acyltransferase family protein [Candidatus Amulumruptor caecigallinarius]MCM1453212.1 lysophospholipid acyltransferase family protein [bacterium]